MDIVRLLQRSLSLQGLVLTKYRDHDITDAIYETFSVEDEVFGEKVTIDLKPGGRDIEVTNDNKKEWVE